MLDGEEALPSDEQHDSIDPFHRNGEDLGVVGHHSLETPWGKRDSRSGLIDGIHDNSHFSITSSHLQPIPVYAGC